jgi:Uma2 family endonuclease
MPVMQDVAFFTLAPDWICEVLSPSTEGIDRGRKLRIYADAGIAHAWLVNRLSARSRFCACGMVLGRSLPYARAPMRSAIEPFEAIELPLGRLWLESPGSADTAP